MKKMIKGFSTYLKCIFKGIKHSKGLYLGHKVHFTKGKIVFGKNVQVRPYTDIFCDSIFIGDNCDIGTRNRICGTVKIESNVLIGPDNFIASNTHLYEKVEVPIISQGAKEVERNGKIGIIIGEGSWIGTHCAILGSVTIGRHCVIGANTVLNFDVPDYSVVVGNPDRIVKRYDFEKKEWTKVKRS